LAFSDKANPGKVAGMFTPTNTARLGARGLARLLGEWRPSDGRGLADALTDRVRLLVLDGRLPLHTRVPAERELAAALGVSRTTVAATYEALRGAGVLHSRRGAGSWIQLRGGTSGATPFSPNTADPDLHDLAHAALPAPRDAVRSAALAASEDLVAHLGGHGYDLLGLPALRAAIATRFTARGLPTSPDQVLVTSGAQHAIALLLQVLTGPGDRVLVEHPSYPNALDAVRARGALPVPVPLAPGPDGVGELDLDLLSASVRDAAPRLAYLIPDFHNPTGALLDVPGRARLVELARRTGTTVVVDETLAELGLDGPPPPPVAAHGGADSPLLITVGSASKVFWGGLRVGWIRAAAPLVRRLAAARTALDLGGPTLEALVTVRLLADVDAVTAARRAELTAARDHLRGRLSESFPSWRPSRPTGGLSLWVELGAPVSSRLTVAARRHGVLLAAGPRFGLDGAFERYLRLPYTLRRDRMDETLRRLSAAWGELDRVPADAARHDQAVA
jgi:DNA-binding transcriptional MocR family regulator